MGADFMRYELGDIKRLIACDDVEILREHWNRLLTFYRLVIFRKAVMVSRSRDLKILDFMVDEFEGDKETPDWFFRCLGVIRTLAYCEPVRSRLYKRCLEHYGVEWCLTSTSEELRKYCKEKLDIFFDEKA